MADQPDQGLEALQRRALEHQAAGRYAEAADAYRGMVEAATAQLAVLQFNLGASLAAAGRLDEAATAYLNALVARPGWSLALGNLGTVRHLQGRLDDAERDFRAAVSVAPDDADARCNLGASLCAAGGFAEAEVQFRAALASMPGLARAEQGLAMALAALGRVEEALVAYEQVALMLLHAGQPVAALAAAEHACALRPDDAVAAGVLGAALTGAGRLEDAALAYRRARELAPDRFEAHFNWALGAEAVGDLASSAAAYRDALALDPGHSAALSNLARVLTNLDRTGELLEVYQQLRAVEPDNPKLDHLIAAARGELTAAAPRGYVVSEFDGLASVFDALLVGTLGYRAPEQVGALVAAARAGGDRLGAALDLGCGTGLTGVHVRAHVATLHGVDLSTKMIERAAHKRVYDLLFVAELVEFLDGPDGLPRYDLVTATDVFIYLGDLAPVFAALRRRLAPGGRFVFTVEPVDDADIRLLPTGRYAHGLPYLERLAAAHGYLVGAVERGDLRREALAVLPGLTITLRAPDG